VPAANEIHSAAGFLAVHAFEEPVGRFVPAAPIEKFSPIDAHRSIRISASDARALPQKPPLRRARISR